MQSRPHTHKNQARTHKQQQRPETAAQQPLRLTGAPLQLRQQNRAPHCPHRPQNHDQPVSAGDDDVGAKRKLNPARLEGLRPQEGLAVGWMCDAEMI
jgi:hypothetical protein